MENRGNHRKLRKVKYCVLEIPCVFCEEVGSGCQKYQTEKKCTQCGSWLPETEEFFPKMPSGANGLHSWCKVCRNKNKRDNYKHKRAPHDENVHDPFAELLGFKVVNQ